MRRIAPITTLHLYAHHDARQHGIRQGPSKCVDAGAYLTFGELFERFRVSRGRRYIQGVERRLLFRSLLGTQPGPFAELATSPAALAEFDSAMATLRAAGITAGHFDKSAPSAELRPLVQVLRAYEDYLGAHGLEDDADRQREVVLSTARGGVPFAYRELQRVVVHAGGDLFGARLDLLGVLAAAGAKVEVLAPWDAARPQAFAWPEASLHAIEKRGHESLKIETESLIGDGGLSEMRSAQYSDRCVDTAPVRVVAVRGKVEHARQIARQVYGWLRDGVPVDEMCVATPDLAGLGDPIVRALSDLGIPGLVRRGLSLASSAPARLLLSALKLPSAGFARESLIALWMARGKVVVVEGGEARQTVSPQRVAQMLRSAGARSAHLHDFSELILDAAKREDRRRGDGRTTREREAQAVADALAEFIACLSALPVSGTLQEYCSATLDLLLALDLRFSGPSGEGQPRDFQVGGDDTNSVVHSEARQLAVAQAQFGESMEAIVGLLGELGQAGRDLPGEGDAEPWTVEEWIEAWAVACSERHLEARGLRTACVPIIAIDAMQGARYNNVVLAGINAGQFPRGASSDTVLREDLKVEINRLLGPKLLQHTPTEGRGGLHGHARDTWLWLEALASARDVLMVTCEVTSGVDDEGVSDVVEELLRSVESLEIEAATCDYAEALPASEDEAYRQWTFGALAVGARISQGADRERAVALGEFLRQADSERSLFVENRALGGRPAGSSDLSPHVLGADGREAVGRWFAERIHSPSSIDLLGSCTFKFFSRALLGLSREEVATMGADAREDGTMCHAALEIVYRDLLDHGGLAAARADKEQTVARARSTFEKHRDHILDEVGVHSALLPAALDRAWDAVLTHLHYDLAADDDFEPVALEFDFGARHVPDSMPLRLQRTEAVVDGGASSDSETADTDGLVLQVRGQIDRVELGDAGTTLRIIDYKRTPKARPLGRHFQLPLYAAAVRGTSDLAAGAETLELGWAGLLGAKRMWAPPTDASDSGRGPFRAPIAEALKEQSELLWGRVDRVLAGRVAPDPLDKECRHCDFASLCRYEPTTDDDDAVGGAT